MVLWSKSVFSNQYRKTAYLPTKRNFTTCLIRKWNCQVKHTRSRHSKTTPSSPSDLVIPTNRSYHYLPATLSCGPSSFLVRVFEQTLPFKKSLRFWIRDIWFFSNNTHAWFGLGRGYSFHCGFSADDGESFRFVLTLIQHFLFFDIANALFDSHLLHNVYPIRRICVSNQNFPTIGTFCKKFDKYFSSKLKMKIKTKRSSIVSKNYVNRFCTAFVKPNESNITTRLNALYKIKLLF